jgi:hypothetical protein
MDLIELLEWYLILKALGLISEDDNAIELVFVGDAIPGGINGI